MEINISKINDRAKLPKYASVGDAGMDLVATEVEASGDILTCKTGLAIEIPKGYVGLIYPRSSVSKKRLQLANSVGVIDSGYRGEIMLKFRITDYSQASKDNLYQAGDRVGQIIIVPYPQIKFKEVATLEESERGNGGFGSTGK